MYMATKSSVYRQSWRESGKKQALNFDVHTGRPHKRMKALLEEDGSSADEQNTASNGGDDPITKGTLSPNDDGFTINRDFAQRFEHNKKREELQRCKS